MKNWKTTVGGLFAAIGLFLVAQPNPTMHLIGVILAPLAAALTGLVASDATSAK